MTDTGLSNIKLTIWYQAKGHAAIVLVLDDRFQLEFKIQTSNKALRRTMDTNSNAHRTTLALRKHQDINQTSTNQTPHGHQTVLHAFQEASKGPFCWHLYRFVTAADGGRQITHLTLEDRKSENS